mgnify:CR=1 FL=1
MERRKVRILFFIGSLCSGGKERRLVELLSYLKNKEAYEMLLVMTRDEIHYPEFYKLNIPKVVIKKSFKKNDISIFFKLYSTCIKFKPHLIHTWGRIQSFYALPSVLGKKIPLVNSQITAAPPRLSPWSLNKFIDRLNFIYSKVILSNSKAGLKSYRPPLEKSRVIYNGINLGRVVNLPDEQLVKSSFGIKTPYTVLMVASYTQNKNYLLFHEVATLVTKERSDITFIGVGGCLDDDNLFKSLKAASVNNGQILFLERTPDVEALISVCSIGVLFSNKVVHGEGISNAIMEYMALAKPVIANDAGGTSEILIDDVTGFLIKDESPRQISRLMIDLIDDEDRRKKFGNAGRMMIEKYFTIDKMGFEFEKVYMEAATT